MKNFDANACLDAYCDLCESLALQDLIGLDECQYWVFEQGYQSNRASLEEFSQLCDMADKNELVSALDCQFWLFESGYLAARKAQINLSDSLWNDITLPSRSNTYGFLPSFIMQ